VSATTASVPPTIRRVVVADALAAAALLMVAVLPVAAEIAGRPPQLHPAARVHSGFEAHSRRAFTRGELPVWNAYQFGGRPHHADRQTLALYPPHVVLRIFPWRLFVPLSFVLHAWCSGLGAYLVGRYLSASRSAALVGAIGVMLASVMSPATDMAYSPGLYTLAWLPAIVALTLRSIDAPRPLGLLVLASAIVVGVMASPRGPMYVLPTVAALYLLAALRPVAAATDWRRLVGRFALIVGLTVGLGAYQLFPAVSLQASMKNVGGSRSDAVFAESWHSSVARPFESPRSLADELRSLGGGRVLAACERAIDESQLLALGVPAVGGYGGVFAADYARFVHLALGSYTEKPMEYSGVSSAGRHPARPDLLALLNAEFLVSCTAPDPERWRLIRTVDGVGIYRSVRTLPLAFWTCSPGQVGREELEYRLRRFRYDGTLTLQPTGPVVHVRWAADVDDAERARMEASLRIAPERFLGDRTWQYELLDVSPENLSSIVTNPAVEDTSGIDRNAMLLASSPPPRFTEEARDEWLLGVEPCEPLTAAKVLRNDLDGEIAVAVDAPRDGIVFISQTFYGSRRAWVDGRQVEPLNVNLAFIGVPVTAGIHRVELRHDMRVESVSAGVSGATLLAWMIWAWRERSRQ
jgi:hypothetical protein